jgi:hypothetical protein
MKTWFIDVSEEVELKKSEQLSENSASMPPRRNTSMNGDLLPIGQG